MAHLARQHGLVVECFLEVRVGVLPLDGNTEQTGEAGKEVGIRSIELAGVGTVDLEDTERHISLPASRYQDVDRPLDPVIRQQLGRAKACFFLKMI